MSVIKIRRKRRNYFYGISLLLFFISFGTNSVLLLIPCFGCLGVAFYKTCCRIKTAFLIGWNSDKYDSEDKRMCSEPSDTFEVQVDTESQNMPQIVTPYISSQPVAPVSDVKEEEVERLKPRPTFSECCSDGSRFHDDGWSSPVAIHRLKREMSTSAASLNAAPEIVDTDDKPKRCISVSSPKVVDTDDKVDISDVFRTDVDVDYTVGSIAYTECGDKRKDPFSFFRCGIRIGSKINLVGHPEIVATVVDDRRVKYLGKRYYLSSLTKELINSSTEVRGPKYWQFNGRLLTDIRTELESRGMYKLY